MFESGNIGLNDPENIQQEYIQGLVSIIVPNYNRAGLIPQTFQSVLDQTYSNWELIFIDDCSTDDSVATASKFQMHDSRIRIAVMEKNMGRPAGPRNKGLEMARGEFVAFLDSDDIWHRKKIEIQLTAMKECNSLFSSTDSVLFMWDKIPEERKNEEVYFQPKDAQRISFQRILHKNCLTNSSVVASRKLFENIRFDERADVVEDYECWLRIHSEYGLTSIKIKIPLVYYRMHINAISNNKFEIAKKIHFMLTELEFKGKRLGVKRLYYFWVYMVLSLYDRYKSFRKFQKTKEQWYAIHDNDRASVSFEVEKNKTSFSTTHRKKKYFISAHNFPIVFQLIADVVAIFSATALFFLIGMAIGMHKFPSYAGISDVLIVSGVAVVVWTTVFWLFGLYANWYVRSPFDEYFTIIRSTFLSSLTLYFFVVANIHSIEKIRLKVLLYWLIICFFVCFFRFVIRIIQTTLRRKKIIAIPTILIGSLDKATAVSHMVHKNPGWGYNVKCVLLDKAVDAERWEQLRTADSSLPPCGGRISDIEDLLGNEKTSAVILAWENPEPEALNDILRMSIAARVHVKILPDMYKFFTGLVKTRTLYGAQFIEIDRAIMHPSERLLKRIFDVVFSVFLMLLLAPIAFIAVAIAASQGRHASISKAPKVGKNGAVFTMYRLVFASKENEDVDVAALGRIAKAFRLDILPELFNVLSGSMSVVGPKAESPEKSAEFQKIVPYYSRRWIVRPGIVGWQKEINNSDISNNDEKEILSNLQDDFYYIENYSLKFDAEILVRTIYMSFFGKRIP